MAFCIKETLHQEEKVSIYRVTTQNSSWIAKTSTSRLPTASEIEALKQEYEIIAQFKNPHIIQVKEFARFFNGFAILMQDTGGLSVDKLLKEHRLSFFEKIKIAKAICIALEDIHAHHFIYRDIKPANVIYEAKHQDVKLIDFGSAIGVSKWDPELKDPHAVEGTLAYMAPEQTGRMNRCIDLRSDLYSLGVTLYELFTEQLPFLEEDAMSLVHAHLAKMPQEPCLVAPSIPPILSLLILKLMAKNKEDRYQSATGVLADLKKIETASADAQELSSISFTLAQEDMSKKLVIPQKLYGREQELSSLFSAFKSVCLGAKKLLLIKGFSGLGKSALIHEIHQPMTQEKGYFIAGKFDQFKKNIPYSAFISAFESLCKQILTEPDHQLDQWKRQLCRVLLELGQVIIDFVPHFKMIMGEQKPIPELGPQESQNRFYYALQKLMTVICQKEHPLVIFIDDWQWADSASLTLLQRLLCSDEIGHLLIISAYRDNEVDDAHLFSKTLNTLAHQQVDIESITLSHLTEKAVLHLLSDTLPGADVTKLLPILYQKTKGNPFFITQFLKSLQAQGCIEFKSTTRTWCFDVEKIRAQQTSDNVVDFILMQIAQLPSELKQVLSSAACMGHVFDVHTLSIILGQEETWVKKWLLRAVEETLLNTQNESFTEYKFVHDRIQQSFYQLINKEDAPVLHLKIGYLLLKKIPESDIKTHIFEIASHFNQARHLVHQQDQLMLADLNISAAKKAKDNAAYHETRTFCLIAEDCLKDNQTPAATKLKQTLYLVLADAAYVLDDDNNINKCCSFFETSSNPLIAVQSVKLRLKQDNKKGAYQQAISRGVDYLNGLGISFSKNPSSIHVVLSLLYTLLIVFLCGEKKLKQKPTTHKTSKICGEFICEITPAAFINSPLVFAMLTFLGVRQSYLNGVQASTPMMLSAFSVIVGHMLGQMKWALKLCQLSRLITNQYYPCSRPSTDLVEGTFIRFFISLTQQDNCSKQKEEGICAMEMGDMQYAGFIFSSYQTNLFYSQSSLDVIKNESSFLLKSQKIINHDSMSIDTLLNIRVVERLSTLNDLDMASLSCDTMTEDSVLSILKNKDDKTTYGFICVLKVFLLYLAECNAQAPEHKHMQWMFCEIEKYLESMEGSAQSIYFRYIQSLYMARTGLVDWKKLNAHIRYFKKHSARMPANFIAKYTLLLAEKARLKKQFNIAETLYDKAITYAQEHRYISDEAIICECAAAHYLKQSRSFIADIYIIKARDAFYRFGALAKVKQIETKYQHVFNRSLADSKIDEQKKDHTLGTQTIKNINTTKRIKNLTLTQTSRISETLDMMSIIKATQALSKEVHLGLLITQMLDITLENVGANKGLFIVKNKGHYYIEGMAHQNEKSVLQHLDIYEQECSSYLFSKAIVKYVIRTQESVVIKDALHDEQFSKEPYIATHRPQSILCVPIIQQAKLLGVLYMENNLATNAFTEERLLTVNLLASQAAISLENVLLYENLEEEVKARTAKIEKLQEALLKASRDAGKAEIASHMLHNAGNALNQINTSTELIQAHARMFKVGELNKALSMMESNQSNLAYYLTQDSKGKNILTYLFKAGKLLQEERDNLIKESESLKKGIELMRDIINSQQTHAKTVMVKQELTIDTVLEDALLREQIEKSAHQIHVTRNLEQIKNKTFKGDKELIIQVLSVILSNAKKNMIAQQAQDNQLLIEVLELQDNQTSVFNIHVESNGLGIQEKDQSKIFNYDYTTDTNTVGYGLHHAANTAQMMGGSLALSLTKTYKTGLAFDFIVPKN